ncbi:MAG TPA: hypothetical protein LFV92_02435 [Rickettsia endosymbiont of Ceroptres masudai]|nr:hypothetical protein [Rickettsia endosymbiont of Ceroptres masudai]
MDTVVKPRYDKIGIF